MINEKKLEIVLNPSRFKGAEYERREWVITAEFGTKIEDLLNPAYWAHVSAQMQPYDRIEARVDDGTWFANFLVLDCSRNFARVHLLNFHNLETQDVAITKSLLHEVAFKGPKLKFCVIRLSDREILHSGVSKIEANRWMEDYEKVIA